MVNVVSPSHDATSEKLVKVLTDVDAKSISTLAMESESLRSDMVQRRESLTMKEMKFLDSIISSGNLKEIEEARRSLRNKEIFLEFPVDVSENEDEGTRQPKRGSSMERAILEVSGTSIQKGQRSSTALRNSAPDVSQSVRPSLLREQSLNMRRNSSVHSSLWKAYENGISTNTNFQNPRSSFAMRRSLSIRGNGEAILKEIALWERGLALPKQHSQRLSQRGSILSYNTGSVKLSGETNSTANEKQGDDLSERLSSHRGSIETRKLASRRASRSSINSGPLQRRRSSRLTLSHGIQPDCSRRQLNTRSANASVCSGEGFEIIEEGGKFGQASFSQTRRPLNDDKKEDQEYHENSLQKSSSYEDIFVSRGPGRMSFVDVRVNSFGNLSELDSSSSSLRNSIREDMSSCVLRSGRFNIDEVIDELNDEQRDIKVVFNAWQILQDDTSIGLGYGAGGTLPFLILGTSADDTSATPHVLSPPLMESLQQFMPSSVDEGNFWLKFSMVRDGSSLHTMLENVHASKYTVLALETVDGEVFGSFSGEHWRKTWSFFGNGESFLWRMKSSRGTPCHSVVDQAQIESELEVFPWTGDNNMVQCCTSDRIALGGGELDKEHPMCDGNVGFGLAIDNDLQHGTSTSCATFANPCLSQNGCCFEIMNLEVWTLTNFTNEEDAERMEMTRLFLENS